MDLNKLVMDSLKKMESEKTIEQVVQKEIEKTVGDIVHELYGKYSQFAKELKKTTQEELQVNFSEIDLSTYNHMILNSVQDILDKDIKTKGAETVAAQIKLLLQDPKREYKLSELVKELAEDIEDLDDLGFEDSHEMSLHVEHSDYGSIFISMDAQSDVSKYNCKYRLFMSEEGHLYSVRINNEERMSIGGIDFQNAQIINGATGLDKILLKIFTSHARIIVDESSCQVEISNPEYD